MGSANTSGFDDVAEATHVFRRLTGKSASWRPDVGLILGSGLGGAAEQLGEGTSLRVEMSAIPGLTVPHVEGHRGRFLVTTIGGQNVIVQQGRIHAYEGHSICTVTQSVRLMCRLGIRTLILTNAAGGIREDFRAGDLMVIRDHLRLPHVLHPVWHELPESEQHAMSPAGGRLPCPVWDEKLRALALSVPTRLKVHEGTYAMMPGPAYETPAEVRMMRTLGANAVGMSTVPEALCGVLSGVRVLGVSCITNVAAGLQKQTLSHAEVTATANAVGDEFCAWMSRLLHSLASISTVADSRIDEQ